MSFAWIAAVAVGFAAWHCRPTIAAALDAWRASRHPVRLGPLTRLDHNRSTP